MFRKKKCTDCRKKVEKKFNYCPYCGVSFKKKKDDSDFGILGKDDNLSLNNEMKLPFGLNKIMGSLVKQLEKQLGELDENGGEKMPKGFRIQISRGSPQVQRVMPTKDVNEKSEEPKAEVGERELNRRKGLPRVEAPSVVRRIDDKIVYELSVPDVKKKEDVVLSRLEQGIEIKAYSKDKCYVKTIPLKVEVLGYSVRKEKLFVELKG